jgi:predicted metal-dependent peptidase
MAKKTKKPAAARVARAKSVLSLYVPFYGTILAHMDMIESDQFPTMATDGSKCYFNPAFIDGLTDAELIFVEAHEASHCANLHHTRRQGRDPREWNIAADYVINAELVAAEIGTMPKDGLLDSAYTGMSTEQVYAARQNQPQGGAGQPQHDQPQGSPETGEGGAGQSDTEEAEEGATEAPGASQGQDGQEQGAQGGPSGSSGQDQADDQGDDQGDQGEDSEQDGDQAEDGQDDAEGQNGEGDGEAQQDSGPSDPGGCGEILDACPADDKAGNAEQEREWQTITRQAINAQMRHDAGKLPAHLQRLANELNKPRQNWRDALRRFVDQSNRFDYSWQNPDRRFPGADFILPGLIADGVNHIVIVRDTSGSINQALLSKFNAEAQSMVDDGLIQRLTVIDCDAAVHRVVELEQGDTIPATAIGGGGTSYRPVWRWLKDQADVSAVVYFTDLDPNDGYGDEPHVPVLWAAWASISQDYLNRCMTKVPWGEIIELSE